jgi:hypothetical protein
MDKFEQATTDQLYFRDPDIEPPPKGKSMLLLNPGGVCVIGIWSDSCIGWCPKPKIPKALKDKNYCSTHNHKENSNEETK